MAGIGFRLQKILRKNTYRGLIEAYLYSALVSTGPWLLSIFGLGLIGILVRYYVTFAEASLFRAIVVYTFMASLVATGPLQLGTTRYIADRLYLNDKRALLPCFHWVGFWVLVGGGLLAAAFYGLSGLPLSVAASGVVLFQMICLCWAGMIFLSAAKDYMAIVRAFALGYGLGVVGALLGAARWQLPGLCWGFTLGQVVLVWLLAVRVRKEFPSERAEEAVVFEHLKALPHLIWIGLFYNAGIWVDKVIFWFGPHGKQVAGPFYASQAYDTCLFIAYVSIVPSMALFLIRIETGFYKHYAAFYSVITQGGAYDAIMERKREMIEALRLSVARLLKLQGAVTLVCILQAPVLAEFLGLGLDLVALLRVAMLAALVQVMLLILLIVLLYFDWRREVALISLLFFFSNALLTLATQFGPDRYHGFGYLVACLLTLCTGLIVFERKLETLEYETFTKQPILA